MSQPTPTGTSRKAADRAELERRIARLPPEKRDLLMRKLRRQGNGSEDRALPRLVPDPEARHEPFPLSEIQKVYWIGRSGLYDLGGGGTNAYLELELAGFQPEAVARLEAALRRLVARHDSLRTVFPGDGRQRVLAAPGAWDFPVGDLRKLPPEAAEEALERVREEMRYAAAPLDRWPLFEFRGHLLPENRLRLMMRVETSLVDGDSREVFFGDLFTFYADPDRELPEPEITYRDYVVTWKDFRRGPLYGQARQHWLERLEELPPPPAVPLRNPVTPATIPRLVNREARTLVPDDWRRFKQHAGAHGLTPSAALAAAFAATLAAAGSGDAFTVSMVGSQRPPIHPQMDRILGNFNRITLLPVASTEGSFVTRAERLQEELRSGLDHAHFTGSEVLRELGRRHPGRRPPAPVAFNSLVEAHASEGPAAAGRADRDGESPPRPDFRVQLVDAGIYVPQLLLLMTVDEFGGALHHRSQAAEDVLAEGWAQGIWEAFGGLLQRLAENPETWAGPFASVADAERAAAAQRSAPEVLEGLPEPMPRETDPGPPPRDGVEGWLADTWEELLGRRPEGVQENFFALGGDSFAAARLAARVRERFGEGDTPLWHFFDRPTVAGLAELLRGRHGGAR